MPLEIPLLYRVVLALLSFLFLHMRLSIVLSMSVRNYVAVLIGIALNLYISFGRIDILTMLNLPIQDHEKSFHSLMSSSISFFKDLKFLSRRSFICLIIVTARYFMLLLSTIKREVAQISFLVYYLYIGGLLIYLT